MVWRVVGRLEELMADGIRFSTIYADPPWLYSNQSTRAATSNHYEGMTVQEICSLPVLELVAEDAHLHLWTTNGFLFECPKIFEAWGFEFKSSFVWVKSQIGIGNYWRNAHEFLLTAVRGDAKRFNDRTLRSWMECDRGRHSGKPEQVRAMIEKASQGPRLELFGRRAVENWFVWGNQVERDIFTSAVEEGRTL
jgi:N6-adenosine-specific RNA methylase IME4